jgi:hypothetical protein
LKSNGEITKQSQQRAFFSVLLWGKGAPYDRGFVCRYRDGGCRHRVLGSEKYHYVFWRPVTAIPLADTDGNPATSSDPAWMPLFATPAHPEYPSGTRP